MNAASGTVVILVHGAVANRKTWLPLERVLPDGLEAWCPDLPGHGERRDEPFDLARAVDDIVDLLAKAGPRKAIVAGDSLGGYVALAVAARRPRGLCGIVAGGCTWSMTGFGGLLARLSDLPPELIVRGIGVARAERVAASLVSRVADAETARAIVAAGLRLESRGESLRQLAGIDLVELVRGIRVPIAFVNGRYDWPTRAGEGALVRAAPAATLVTSPRCGHGVGFFDPVTFAAAIGDVVRRSETESYGTI